MFVNLLIVQLSYENICSIPSKLNPISDAFVVASCICLSINYRYSNIISQSITSDGTCEVKLVRQCSCEVGSDEWHCSQCLLCNHAEGELLSMSVEIDWHTLTVH